MSGARNCSRLCRLIDDSLRPYREMEVGSVTKEKEKVILLSLSQVFRQVKLWNQELHSDSGSESNNGSMVRLSCESECSGGCSSHSEEIQCLSQIVADLVYLLTVNSRYVSHLVGNVLLAISEFLAASGSNWGAFIQFLCICLELAINTLLADTSAPLLTGANDSNCDSSSFVLALKDKLKGANWSELAGIMRVLRYILKYLTPENDLDLISVYFDSVNSRLSNVHWDSFTEIFAASDGNAQKSSVIEALFQRYMFLGNLVQFFCSLVEQSRGVEDAGDSMNKHPVVLLTIVLVPKLLSWCLGKRGDCITKSIFQYLRHKLLVLMIRLSFRTSLDSSILVSWLKLIRNYFDELLRPPVTPVEIVQNDSLEGSPFLLSMSDEEVNNLSSLHVQRRAIFLFLRCSFSLINLKGVTTEECACAAQNLCLPYDSNVELECCGMEKGLVEIYNWLQGHVPTEIYQNHEMYLRKCLDFTLSFLKLYMHEDDLLFRVLLQLLSVPVPAEEKFQKTKEAFQDKKHDMLSHVSNVFNPVHLFHLFLSELHYDHQVLLDYLISKDTGISCAEYLLRCLRTIFDSWSLFVQFSANGHCENQVSYKKRKFLRDDSNFHERECSVSARNEAHTLLEEKYMEGFEEGSKYSGKQYQPTTKPYEKAKECLLALKVSVESLHKKNLFPYNPKVLLKRLGRFQELCHEEKKNYL
ncbi:Protein Lines [Trema orientale]|uniref:Protein Lines n=1 Tax=Trema orientale TaxID=63057 RepID=A0A2P5FY31_TREOI|nr:Protein Lines [Trema orientale]